MRVSCSPGNRGDPGRADPDQQSRVAAGHTAGMARLESRLDGKISGLESRFDAMEYQFGELRERMAHLEGLLEGLREAISGGPRPVDEAHIAELTGGPRDKPTMGAILQVILTPE